MSSQNAYLDVDGRPRLRESIVAFFDVLGFSQLSTASGTITESQQVLDRIVAAVDDSRAYVRESLVDSKYTREGRWALKFFSDNLSFAHPLDGDGDDRAAIAWFVIHCAQRYQLGMTINGSFLRGGVTQGPICLTDDIIFGSALVESYHLESKASIVPRVVLAEPLQDLVLQLWRAGANPIGVDLSQAVCRDIDGWWFVNYLQAARKEHHIDWAIIERHKSSILESLSHTTRHEVLPKYGWACRYHNVFCHWHRDDPGYSDRFRIDRADEHSTIYRLSDASEDYT